MQNDAKICPSSNEQMSLTNNAAIEAYQELQEYVIFQDQLYQLVNVHLP